MHQAFTRQASSPTATVIQLKPPRRYIASAAPPPRETGDMLKHECVTHGNFCRCWMPAWFHLAELVGQERRGANAGRSDSIFE